jgi:hypothetical protein
MKEFMMKTDRRIYVLFAAMALTFSLISSACATGNLQIYGLGDVVDVGFDQRMVLSAAEFLDDKLEATFTIENVGTEESSYNLMLSLQARNAAGTPQGQLIPCGSNMDGALQPGEQATGMICWSMDGATLVRIHYNVLLSETDILWEVVR